MKTPFSLALGSIFCLLLSSCVTESLNPLSSPAAAHADPRLIGDWLEKRDQEVSRITMKKAPWMHVDIIPSDSHNTGDSYDFYPTVIGKNTFLNVVMIGKDDQGHPTKGYLFIRYEISGNHELHMWKMSQDEAAAAVQSGKLKGIVRKKSPIPPDSSPDVDVTLTDSGARLVKFIQTAEVNKLFSEKLETLVRTAGSR